MENCVINPATGRAVKADSRLGKKLMEAKQKAEPKKAEPKKAEPKKAEPKKQPKKAEPKKEPKKAEPKKEPNQQYSKAIGPVKPKPKDIKLDADGGVKRKFDADYIKRYAKHIYDKYPPEGLRKALEKAKNGDEVKEFYDDYTAGMGRKMYSLEVIVDENLTQEERIKLFEEDKLAAKMYYHNSKELRAILQEYLFKFEEPAG